MEHTYVPYQHVFPFFFFSFSLTWDTEFQMEIHAVTFFGNRPNFKNVMKF